MEERRESITGVVERIVENSPLLKECLASGVANYSSVARMIKPVVDEELGFDASVESIKVALVRLSRKMSPLDVSSVEKILGETSIEVKTRVTVMTYDSSSTRDVLRVVSGVQGARFLSVVTGITNVTVMVGDEQARLFTEGVGSKPLFYQGGLTAIVLVSPVENVYTPGLIAYITSLLAQTWINIIQITSSYSETVIVVSPEDTMKAFNVLNDAVSRARKKSGRRV